MLRPGHVHPPCMYILLPFTWTRKRVLGGWGAHVINRISWAWIVFRQTGETLFSFFFVCVSLLFSSEVPLGSPHQPGIMAQVKACGWMLLPLCILAFTVPLVQGACDQYVDITYIESAMAKGAVCLDGSAPAYHLSPGFGTGVNNWLVHFEGGGWCNDVTSCLARKFTNLGSSTAMNKQAQFSGILSNYQQCNPDFYNWNKVKIRYCDGSSFTGDVQEVDPSTNLHYRGQKVFIAVMEELLSRGMNQAQNALLSGCSAGGLASMLHCDSFRSFLPSGAKVKCLADAGFFIDVMTIDGKEFIKSFYNGVVTLHGSAKHLPQSCTSSMSPNACFFPQYMAWRIQTPLFLLNPAYDSWQISNILVPDVADPSGTWKACKTDIKQCSASQLEMLQRFRTYFLKAIGGLGPSSSRGLFINSCFAHCQSEDQRTWLWQDSPVLGSTQIGKAIADWYYDRNAFQQIDCAYPCNPTCSKFYTYSAQKQWSMFTHPTMAFEP